VGSEAARGWAGVADEEDAADWFRDESAVDAASGTERGDGAPDDGADPDAAPGDGEDLFEENFEDALGESDGVGGDEGFPAEDPDSDIDRVDVGVEGLDSMIQGGVPDRSLMVVMGAAGTGKTTFGLQFLFHALDRGERAVFIALEESRESVVDTADEKGWDFSGHVEAGNLAVVDLNPIEMANSLTSIRNELPGLVDEFGASRLVLDSVSLLELMYDDQAVRRTEIYEFTESLKDAGITTMVTSEAASDDPFTSRHGIIEYLTDAVFVLRYIRPEDFRETRLAIEIQKIRNANHSRETKPYDITNSGISVYRQANIF
jgi:KaiC domain protein